MTRIWTAAALCLLAAKAASAAYIVQELFPLAGDFKAHAFALNASGQVVGYSRDADGTNSAVFWQAGGPAVNLSPTASPTFSFIPLDINDVGQVVGYGADCGFP